MYRSRSVKTRKLKTKSKHKLSKSKKLGKSKRRVSKSKKLSKRKQRGGTSENVFIGPPYNAAAAEPQGNYYAYNQRVEAWPVPSNSQFGTQFVGGARKSKSKKHKGKKYHGGGISEMITTLLPEELVNIGRAVPASLGRMYDRFDGSLSSPSSMVYPTQQPLASTLSSASTIAGVNRMMTPPDLLKFYNTNNNQVSRL
jgi:hypothetical protein